MGTLPGAAVIPQQFGNSMVLYTATDRVEAVVDGAPVGPTGRLYVIEPGKAHKVPYEVGRFVLEHLAYTGVVRVQEKESDTGITYDVEGAKAESLALTHASDEKRFHQFVSDMVEDYIKRNKPVPPPPPSMVRIIERRGYDLKKYGIKCIGFQEPESDLQKENDDLKQKLAELTAKVDALAGKKGK